MAGEGVLTRPAPRMAVPGSLLSDAGPSVAADRLDAWINAALASVPEQADPYAVIDGCVNAEMRTVGAPGASIAIAVNGVITLAKSYGLRHRENGGAIDARTLFRIGSSTKMMTAAALMTQVDAGRLDLHAPITRYLPELRLPEPWQAGDITVHHLLSHTSGLPDSYRLHRLALFNSVPVATWAEDYLPRTAMAAPPGVFWNYSNPGYSLAGYLLERVTGSSHAEYTERQVWRPAGMPLTTFSTADVMESGNFAWGHEGGRRIDADDLPAAVLSPAGLAFSTPTEMVTWALMLMRDGGAVLSPASAAAMQTPYAKTDWSPWERYGYGIFISEFRDRRDPERSVTVYEHAGNTTGWGSQLYWVPERGIAVSILDNTTASLGASALCVLRELAGLSPRSNAGLTTNPQSWDAFTGTYAEMNQALWDASVRITRDGDHLLLHRLEAGSVLPLANVYGNTFGIDADRDGRADSGAVTQLYTFSGEPADSGRIRWMHNRIQVSERVGQFPASVALSGSACRTIAFTPEIDIPRLMVRASGLVPPGREILEALPIAQDDPADPSTASFKRDITIRGEAGLFTVRLVPQPGDAAELYLLGDRDADGRFAYPDELIDVGWEGQGYRVMTATGRLPAGRYQIWVHGTAIRGANRTFSLETQLVHGDHLRIASAPASARAGEPAAVTVCAQGLAGTSEPMTGLVEFDYGSPPRRVRIPVDWVPENARGVYLPWVADGG
jgi:CubicO group peptidase (beta-lactamase class C family)